MKSRNDFYTLARKSLAGLTTYPTLVAHCTVNELSGLITTGETKSIEFDSARHQKRNAFLRLRAARVEVDEFIDKAILHLTAFLGSTWNASWSQIGLSGSLHRPRSGADADRARILSRVQAYFGPNDMHQNLALNLTAGRAEELNGEFTAAVQGVTGCRQDTRTKRDARDAAEAALEKKLRCLWTELESVLSPTDPRWLQFIDRIPGDLRVPEKVENVTASAQTGGIIVVDWPDAARAARYKIFKQVVGVDAAPVLAATVEDSDGQVNNVPEGATVKLQIVPTNGVGDGPASDVLVLQAA